MALRVLALGNMGDTVGHYRGQRIRAGQEFQMEEQDYWKTLKDGTKKPCSWVSLVEDHKPKAVSKPKPKRKDSEEDLDVI